MLMSEEVLSISIRFSSYDGSGKPTYNYTREEEVNSPVKEFPFEKTETTPFSRTF